jgi:chemotaxis protein MotB
MAEQPAKEAQGKEKEVDNSKRPIIIIKRVVGGHGGHHGGAWKVAYADFVTAMMAFFLLLWLLNSVTSDKLRGIAQYFEPTVGIYGSKGIGFEGGQVMRSKGASSSDKTMGVVYGVASTGNLISSPERGNKVKNEDTENEQFSMVEGELKKTMAMDKTMAQMQDSVEFEITPEGLEISLTDQDRYPMFKAGSVEIQTYTKNILAKIANLIKYTPNYISISGHTDSDTSTDKLDYTNWELSADRANTARRFLIENGVSPDHFSRVVGRADTDPIDINNPYSPRNRRIKIVLLRDSLVPYSKVSAPQELVDPTKSNFDNNQQIFK